MFLASQLTLADRPVVLKLMPGEANEHLSLARLQHTHIVPLYSVQDHPDRGLRALCMPYFGGATLAQLLGALAAQPPGRRTGRALLDAVRDAGNRWIFPDQLTDGLEPWGGVRAVWAAGSPQSTHAVDVTDTFDAGVASLKEHKAYIEGLGWEGWDPEEFLDGILRAGGQGLGVTHAATFEVFPLGWS